MQAIETGALGALIEVLLGNYAETCQQGGDEAICSDDGSSTADIACISLPEGDASNLLIELSNGQRFRIQVYARP